MIDFKLFLKGIAMGAANVIPGVSGGTVAFITGIYERLIDALKSFNFKTLSLILRGQWSEFFTVTDFRFVVTLIAGIALSILSLAKLMELAFEYYETYTLAFFFGLILASIFAVSRKISEVNFKTVITFSVGFLIAGSIAFLPPAQPNDSFFYIFICGVVAVCSFILPGLSGSYILLLMGNYLLVLRAVSQFNLGVILPLMVGCIIGLIAFSRLLSYLFKQFKDQTISLLSGFVAGSLIIIWPWKQTIFDVFEGKEKAVGYIWNIPKFDAELPITFFLLTIGFISVWLIERKSN